MNIDLSKYSFFSGKIENFSRLSSQGFCNENYSFQMDDKRYLFRKFKAQNIDRKFELKAQTLAYEKGLAAKPILLDEDKGFMICEFLEGHHKDVLEKNDLKNVADILKELHTIQVDTEVLKLEDLLEVKSQLLIKAFDIVKRYPTEYVLCHNDLNSQNILFSDDVKLIDWEFAFVNDKYFDLASFCVEFYLDEDEEKYFLEAYFSSPNEIKKEKLKAYKSIYIALCQQWFDKSEINTPI